MATFTTNQNKVEALYVGYYGRAGDPAGVNYWTSQLNAGAITYTQLASSFAVQTESTGMYAFLANPSITDSGAFVDQVYLNLFGRVADAAGKSYWQAQLAAGNNSTATIGAFILNVISGAQGSDAATVMNKVAVATYFTNSLSAANQPYNSAADAEGRSEVTSTDSSSTSVTVNEARADTYASTGDTFTLTTALDSFVGGGNRDTFLATHSDGGTNTLNVGDILVGNAGVDTLSITPSIPTAATTLVDGLWNAVSGIENLSIATGAGVIGITTGAAFQAAFAANGANLSATTTGGAINIDMTSFTGAETVTTSSGAGAETIVTGSGVSQVTATSTAGALTIHGVGLATVVAITSGAGAQSIGDLIGGGANLVSVTATANTGAQTIHSTSTSAVTVNATANGGPQLITTGSGSDVIIIGSSGSAGTINAGAGADAITLGATHSGVDQIIVTPGQSVQSAFDTVTNFSMTVSDTLALGSTTLLNTAQLGGGFTVTTGMATGGTLDAFLLAATNSTTAGVVAFNNGSSTYVVASDGLVSGAADSLVQLVGVTTATALGGAAAATMIHIV